MKSEDVNTTKDKNKQSSRKGRKESGSWFRLLLSFLCLCVTLGCVLYLGNYFLMSKVSQDNVKELKDLIPPEPENPPEVPEMVEVNGRLVQKKYAELYRANPDFIGWITIPDTKVDYPVMQNMEENEYYIHRNFNKEWDDSGLPFLDFRCSFTEPTDNLLIYGHNMKAGTMFSGILNYNSQDFYESHPTFTFHTIDGDGEYQVIAAFYSQIYPEEDKESFKYYLFFDADSEEEFDVYVERVKALTAYDIEETAEYGDQLITLSTCAYHTEDGRFAVVAKKIN